MRTKLSVTFAGSFEAEHVKEHGVYRLFFEGTSLFYIGSTNSKDGFAGRWRQHRALLRNHNHPNTVLQQAFNMYGEQCLKFKIEELCEGTDEYIFSREQYYLNTLNPPLNVSLATVGCVFPDDWKSPTAQPILQYDLDGNFIKEYASIAEAAKNVGRCYIPQTQEHLAEYTTQSGGFQWRYKQSDTFPLKIPKYAYKQATPIICYDAKGDFYKEYVSILAASKELGFDTGNIYRTVNGEMRSYNGYFFKEKTSENYPLHIDDVLRHHKHQRYIDIWDLETGAHYHFDSLRQIPADIISRGSLHPYIAKGLSEFTIKSNKRKKLYNVKIQEL